LQPQQPLVDEFGNVIPTDNVTAVDGFAADNFTAEQEQAPLVDEFGNAIPVESLSSENITLIDNFTAEQLPQQPLVDEFGNIIPTENATALPSETGNFAEDVFIQ